jgi:hypothetical protein
MHPECTLSKIVTNGHATFDADPCPGVIESQAVFGAPLGYATTTFWNKQNMMANKKPCRYITDDLSKCWMLRQTHTDQRYWLAFRIFHTLNLSDTTRNLI